MVVWGVGSSHLTYSLFVRFPLTFWKTELRVGEISPKMLMGLSGFCGGGPELKMYTTATPAPGRRASGPIRGHAHMTSTLGGGRVPKSRQKEQIQLISVGDKGEG